MKTYLNPDSLVRNPAFSQAVVVEGAAKTIYVGGQNAVRPDGAVVGGTLAEQARQALLNVQAVLAAAGATLHDVARWTIAIVDGYPPAEGFAAFREAWGNAGDPPAISVHIGLGAGQPALPGRDRRGSRRLTPLSHPAVSPGRRWRHGHQPSDIPCSLSASCRSRSAFGPTPCSLPSSAAGTFASWRSSVYPAAVSARVADAPGKSRVR